VEVLRDRGLDLGICTSASKSFVDLVSATDSRFSTFKERIIFREMYVNGKPDPEPLQLMFSRMGLSQRECLYVGDAYSDYMAASAAGCRFVYFCPQGGVDHRIPKNAQIIKRHADLLTLLP
jgi:HAD superfamily hydrolase (TIGR01549 family)